ncbi:MAG: protein translocase subunit SecDF [Bacteroidaceae bacterium]|nr:protein translocase subunit SecDF [Bacteroidaceae bacterium]
MQNKGLVKVFAVLLVLVCIYYLSFSFVTRHYEGKAAKMEAKAGQYYLDSLKNEKVWFGAYTLKQCQEMQIGLGLDLKGGMNVVLEVSVPDVIKSLADHSTDPNFTKALAQATAEAQKSQDDFISLFVKDFQAIAGKDKLNTVFATQQLKGKVNTRSTDSEIENVVRSEVKAAVDNSYNVLRSRIDRFGVAQPNIQTLEGQMGRIMVELPGIKEPDRIRKLLQGSANLEFWETYDASIILPYLTTVDSKLAATVGDADTTAVAAAEPDTTQADTSSSDAILKAKLTGNQAQQANATSADLEKIKREHPLLAILQPVPSQSGGCMVGYALARDTAEVTALLNSEIAKSALPEDLSLKWGVKPSELSQKQELYELYAIKTSGNNGRAPLEGDVIVTASTEFDQYGRPSVSMEMNTDGARTWADLTKKNINHAIAIVLDDVVYSAPNVMNEITGGRSSITGHFTTEDTKDLANVLNSGKMPAPAHIVQEDIVGPSLGQKSINQGFISSVLAFVLLMIYMCLVYGMIPGLITNFALLLNLFFTFGILTSFQAALTMSGIAGMVLTLGMAVDANVLIYERTKEELRAGHPLYKSVNLGYQHALSAIIDSNATSIITGIILFYFGTGPVRGFATTLIIGLLASVFTAVCITRLFYDYYLGKKTKWKHEFWKNAWQNLTFTTKYSQNMMKNPQYHFMSAYKKSFLVWGVLIVICIGSFLTRGLSTGIDFTGGRNFEVKFEQTVQPEAVRELVQASMPEANVSVIALGNDYQTVRISTNYRIEENDPSIDAEIEQVLYKSLSDGKLLSDKVTLEDFKNTEKRDGGSIISSQKVGPSIAKDVTHGAIISVLLSLIAIFIYILIRFRNVAFSLGSTIALACDATLIIGTYSLLWGIVPFSLEVDQTFIGAILTCIGYSINDKVVVFDRVREYLGLYPNRDKQLLFNQSLNSTLARTINTSITTLLVLLVIFIFGGDSIRSFAFAMILGVVYGTLSSLFIAAPLAYITLRGTKGIKADESIRVQDAQNVKA